MKLPELKQVWTKASDQTSNAKTRLTSIAESGSVHVLIKSCQLLDRKKSSHGHNLVNNQTIEKWKLKRTHLDIDLCAARHMQLYEHTHNKILGGIRDNLNRTIHRKNDTEVSCQRTFCNYESRQLDAKHKILLPHLWVASSMIEAVSTRPRMPILCEWQTRNRKGTESRWPIGQFRSIICDNTV